MTRSSPLANDVPGDRTTTTAVDWLSLLHADSAFPAGGASHSAGLEGAVQCGFIRTPDDLAAWLHDYLAYVLVPCDLTAAILACRVGASDNFGPLFRIDARLNALKVPHEEREASRMLGQRRLKIAAASLRNPVLQSAWEHVCNGSWNAHQACSYGLIGESFGLGELRTATGLAYHMLAGMTSAAIRLRVCGQQTAQDILTRLGPVVASLISNAALDAHIDHLASCAPAAEYAQMHHECARVRLFMS